MSQKNRHLLSRRGALQSMAAASLLAWPAGTAFAQKYPDKPVRLILPFGAGGVADTTSRLVAEKLGEVLGQRFVIENLPGPGSIAAARAATQGGNDGYTLLWVTNGTAISAALFKKLSYDPVKDFAPVSSVGTFQCLMTVNASSSYQTLADFVKAAKDRPGKVNVGTVAAGSSQHMVAELFKSVAGLDFVVVPFKTSGEAVVGVLRNDIDMVIDFLPPLKGSLADGKLRALARSGTEPSPALRSIPVAGQTVPGFDVMSWNAIYAPAGTPASAIETLNQALRKILVDEGLRERALDMGIDLNGSAPDDIHKRLQGDIALWNDVIDKAKIERR